jgi:hypothetical protein
MSFLIIRPEKLSEKNDLKAIAVEDHTNDYLLDLYLVFDEILSITYFDRNIAQQLIRKIVTFDVNSRKALNKLLTDQYLRDQI